MDPRACDAGSESEWRTAHQTVPWLLGSLTLSWWLDNYPSESHIELVASARCVYLTHSHPDHLHLPTLRRIGPALTLHPDFPDYRVPGFLRSRGFTVRTLSPAYWYSLSHDVRIASVPVVADDSLLILDTPVASVVNLNDCMASSGLLNMIRRRYLFPEKPVIVLRSHSPASSGASTYRDGTRVALQETEDYVRRAGNTAAALGATHFVSFASHLLWTVRVVVGE